MKITKMLSLFFVVIASLVVLPVYSSSQVSSPTTKVTTYSDNSLIAYGRGGRYHGYYGRGHYYGRGGYGGYPVYYYGPYAPYGYYGYYGSPYYAYPIGNAFFFNGGFSTCIWCR